MLYQAEINQAKRAFPLAINHLLNGRNGDETVVALTKEQIDDALEHAFSFTNLLDVFVRAQNNVHTNDDTRAFCMGQTAEICHKHGLFKR